MAPKRKNASADWMGTKKAKKSQPASKFRAAGKIEGFYKGKIVSGSPNAEIKQIDITQAKVDVSTSVPLVVDLLATIAEGTADVQRVGQKILVKSIDLEMNLGSTVGATYSGVGVPQGYMDIALVWDKQPDGSTATAGNIFTSSTTNLTFGFTPNLDRFQVLRRERFNCDIASGYSDIKTWHVPLELATRYADSTGAPNVNGLLVVAVSPNAAAATTLIVPNVNFVARVKFTDP